MVNANLLAQVRCLIVQSSGEGHQIDGLVQD